MTTHRSPAASTSGPVRILRVIAAVLASFLAFLAVTIVLGACFPAIPKPE
ncbi:hypothetical protein ACIA98_43575 [Streptomyces sp. NPDC051366]|nr:hypothetical protein [Streptomyces sp. NBC_01443]MCX4633017.1 hypothetical protein [Streptomyces sp. NBC_01443]WSW48760.1 hypothetical protein OG296_37180 [Streptomyces sp. NBC_01001]